MDKTSRLTPTEVNKAVTTLKKQKAPKIDGKYIAIIHPSVTFDIRENKDWIEAHKYADVRPLFDGEIGELHGVRFVETTEAKVWCDSTCPTKTGGNLCVYSTLFLGKDAFGMIDPEGGGLEMIIKSKEQAGGPLDQFSTIGYKFSTATKILYPERMVRVESTSEYSETDEKN
jgi:N4-gp56 family major capsid protein